MASDAALQFLKEQNRPYSANDIAQNIGKEYSKAIVQKALDKLVSKDLIIDKSYGKQKVYCIKQPNINIKTMDDDLKALDRDINAISTKVTETEEKLRLKSDELKRLEVVKTIEEARSQKAGLEAEIQSLKSRLEKFTGKVEPISAADKSKIYSDHEKYVKEFRKRKRMCTDMLDAIMEGYPKSKKHLIEDTGIETDEEVGFVVKDV